MSTELSLDETRTIPLTRGQVAIVDAADYEWLSQWKWHAQWSNSKNNFYAIRTDRACFPRKTVRMHREILGLKFGNQIQADHINGNTLDNRRVNLRKATSSDNARNLLPRRNQSGLKGAFYRPRLKKWTSQIRVDGRIIYLGVFPSSELAHQAYKQASAKFHGEFGSTS